MAKNSNTACPRLVSLPTPPLAAEEMDANDLLIGILEQRLQAKLGAFDPATILAIIQAIMQVIAFCSPSPKNLMDQARRPPTLARVRVRMALRENGIRPLSTLGREAEVAIFTVGAEAVEVEHEAMVRLCCGR